jgi:hypothetical protein
MPNEIYCDDCFRARGKSEEKTCVHGLMVGIRCVWCGAVRTDWDQKPAWHCLGTTPEWLPLPGRVFVVELFERSPLIHRIDGYDKKHERERKCHRGRVVAMGSPAQTRRGAEILPGFAVGDEVLFVLAKLSDHYGGQGSWSEAAREGTWPATGERGLWVAQEEVIGVFE